MITTPSNVGERISDIHLGADSRQFAVAISRATEKICRLISKSYWVIEEVVCNEIVKHAEISKWY